MYFVDSIVPKANRMDAIAGAFNTKDSWSAQSPILLSKLPPFSKICICPNDILQCFASIFGFQHTILARCSSILVTAPTRHVGAADTSCPENPSRKSFMKIADDGSPTRGAICREEIA